MMTGTENTSKITPSWWTNCTPQDKSRYSFFSAMFMPQKNDVLRKKSVGWTILKPLPDLTNLKIGLIEWKQKQNW
jgi:hypothetical protein